MRRNASTRGRTFLLALAGALLLGAGLARWLERERTVGPRAPGGDAGARPEDPARRVQPDGSLEALAGREAVSGAGSRAVEPELPVDSLAGRIVDRSGRPVAGARVVLTRHEAPGFNVLDLGIAGAITVAETHSDDSGAFGFEIARGVPVGVCASLDGFCDARVADAYAGQELVLTLDPGVLVSGTITRARDGTPVEGAWVRAFSLGGPASHSTRSLPDGSYRLRISFREDATLEVVPALEQPTEWIGLEIGPGDRCRQDVAVADGLVVEGRVTDAVTGRAIAGATVGEGGWPRRTTTTDARGEYRLRGFGAPGARDVGARAAGYSAALSEELPDERDGVIRLDLALRPARAARGRVVDESGAPIAGAYVAAVASDWVDGAPRDDWLSARTGADGRFRIGELAADLAHALLVIRHGYGTQVHDFPERELETAELELEDVVLRRPGLLAGRVEDAGSGAIAGVELELVGWNHDRYRFTNAPAEHGRPYVDRRSARSDARGRFWFGGLSAGRYQLAARAAGRPESAPLALELATGEQRDDLVLRLDAGGTIRGHVLDQRGVPLGGVYVAAQGERLLGDALPSAHVSVRSLADGSFELAGLPEGEYTLRAYPLDTPAPDAGEPWLPATVEHVSTGAPPVRIALARGATIHGRLLAANGAALAAYVVAGVSAGEPEEFALTDALGRFALTVPRASTWTLEVRGPPQSADFQTVFLTRESVAAGSELELRLR